MITKGSIDSTAFPLPQMVFTIHQAEPCDCRAKISKQTNQKLCLPRVELNHHKELGGTLQQRSAITVHLHNSV